MPIYGDEKLRSIGRSVLPASRRRARSAREKRRITHHTTRSRIRDELTQWHRIGPDEFDDVDLAPLPDPQYTGSLGGIVGVMWDRRGGDRLGAIQRWATHHAESLGDDPETRTAALRRVFDDNLIGRHAISHIRRLEPFRPAHDRRDWWLERLAAEAEREAARMRRRDELLTRVIEVAAFRHAELNRAIKDGRCEGCRARRPARLFLGVHDAEAFVDDIALRGSACERSAVIEFFGLGSRSDP